MAGSQARQLQCCGKPAFADNSEGGGGHRQKRQAGVTIASC